MWPFGRRALDWAILLCAFLAIPLAACAWQPLAIAEPRSVVPAVPVVPAEYASTPESVGYYFRESQPDPRLRVLAIHDYIADRVAYDDDALARGVPRDDADAEWVFEHRKGVCAGYANLSRGSRPSPTWTS